jgi:hypothetical protein
MDLARINERFKAIEVVEYDESLEPQLVALTVEMHEHSIYNGMDLDLVKAVAQMKVANQIPGNFYRMARRNGVLMGCVYGQCFRPFFSEDIAAQVKGIWVFGEHQGSAAFIRMLLSFEEWARAQGARLSFLDQTTALDIERCMNLFEGCGYRVIGVNTLKEL